MCLEQSLAFRKLSASRKLSAPVNSYDNRDCNHLGKHIPIVGRNEKPNYCITEFFKRFYLFIFTEIGEGRKKERERNITVWLPLVHSLLGSWPATQTCALTGNRTSDPVVHRPVLNPLSNLSQGYIT